MARDGQGQLEVRGEAAVHHRAQRDRLRDLLSSMATDLGLANEIRIDDLNRVYLPTPLAQERFMRDIERQQALARIQQAQGQPAANVAPPQGGSVWPPPP